MNTNRHEWFLRNAARVEDLAAAREQFVRAATGAAHTVALRGSNTFSQLSTIN